MRTFILVLSLLVFPFATALAQAVDIEEIEMPLEETLETPVLLPDDVKVQEIKNGVYMIEAGGGNLAVSSGTQGLFVIDDGLEERSADVVAAIRSISKAPIKMVVNTHWHYDHTGNNKVMADDHAMLIAHDHVRERLKSGGTIKAFDKVMEPAHLDSLPVLTYDKSVTIHLNDHEVKVAHMEPAHTDGDSFVIWTKLNILHTGDLFFNGVFPFIDASSGGSLKGMIAASEKLLAGVNDETKVIPGHGPLATKADLQKYSDMLKTVAQRLEEAKTDGKTKEEWMAANPLEDLGKDWGGGFLSTEKFTDIVWDAS